MDPGMGLDELCHPTGFAGRQNVGNDVVLPAQRLAGHQLSEESDKFLAAVMPGGFSQHCPRIWS